jgi:hypothetical protein
MLRSSIQRTGTFAIVCKRPISSGLLRNSLCRLFPSSRTGAHLNGCGRKIRDYVHSSRSTHSTGLSSHNNLLCLQCSCQGLAGEHHGSVSSAGSSLKVCPLRCRRRSTSARTKADSNKLRGPSRHSNKLSSNCCNSRHKMGRVSQGHRGDGCHIRFASRGGGKTGTSPSSTACVNWLGSVNPLRTNRLNHRKLPLCAKHTNLRSQRATITLLRKLVA